MGRNILDLYFMQLLVFLTNHYFIGSFVVNE